MFVFVELASDLELFVDPSSSQSEFERRRKSLLGHDKEHINLEGKFIAQWDFLICDKIKLDTWALFVTTLTNGSHDFPHTLYYKWFVKNGNNFAFFFTSDILKVG